MKFWDWGLIDGIQNIILFVPIGFLLFPVLPEKRKYFLATLFGFLFSMFIEINQVFLPTRSPGFNDILTNASGALLGCSGHKIVKDFVRKRSETLLHLGIPVMNLVFLLIPLLWLSSFAAGYDVNRLWLLFLIGIIGTVLISEIYLNRISENMLFYLLLFTILYGSWYLVGVLPSFIRYPKRIAVFTVFLMFLTFLRMRFGSKIPNDKRFEINTIKKMMPLFALYLLLLSQWPVQMFEKDFHLSFLPNFKLDHNYILDIYRFVEYSAAFSMVGYIISQYINRSPNQQHKSVRVLFWLFLTAAGIEGLQGFHPQHSANVLHFIFAFAWGIFGAMIYLMQLDYFKIIKEDEKK